MPDAQQLSGAPMFQLKILIPNYGPRQGRGEEKRWGYCKPTVKLCQAGGNDSTGSEEKKRKH